MFMNADKQRGQNVEEIFGLTDSTPVSDELQRLPAVLEPLCPEDSVITFDFHGKLRLHIDIRSFEEMTLVERLLPTMCGGIFRDVHRGMSTKHSFFHRLTAVVGR